MKGNFFSSTIVVSLLVLLTGCAGGPISQGGHPDVYSRNQSMQLGRVVEGTVAQVREVAIGSGGAAKTLGAIAGGTAGAVLARNKTPYVSAIASIAGVAAGTLAGTVAGQTKGNEVIVKLGKDDYRSIVQERGAAVYQPGQKVLVVLNGMEARIISKL